MDIKPKIEKYFELQEAIYQYFGYKEDWVVIPMDNQIDKYWFITGEKGDSKYCYSDIPFTEESILAGNNIYSGWIYTQRFLKKWVFRGKELTLLSANTHTDGNKCLMIFDNKKECKNEYLKKLYMDERKILDSVKLKDVYMSK